MKKIISLLLITTAISCSGKGSREITITNPLSIDRNNEIVEISTDILSSIDQKAGKTFIIKDNMGTEVPYQLTYDNKIIFPASVKANGSTTYIIQAGTPQVYATQACGKQYPQRLDDIAWENDCIAFRAYGPALQATGEQAFGYDIWVKNTPNPVVEARYETELNPTSRARISELRKTNKAAAQALSDSISYHIDHGNGLDYYKVGPTLGAGTAALLVNDSIVYPYCYNSYQILDNGPLRFTVQMTYNPLVIRQDSGVIETRLLSLDAGSQLNKVAVSYENLSQPTPIVTGIVLHEPSNEYYADKESGFMTYADPLDPVNGQIFIAAVFPNPIKESKTVYFSEKEKTARGGANGHVLTETEYNPGDKYTYYFGGGWSEGGFQNSKKWFEYVQSYTNKVKHPLHIAILY